jgi:hypothetical protein
LIKSLEEKILIIISDCPIPTDFLTALSLNIFFQSKSWKLSQTQWPKEEEQTTQWPKEEEQTTQWPKEKGQKDKQRSTKHYIEN